MHLTLFLVVMVSVFVGSNTQGQDEYIPPQARGKGSGQPGSSRQTGSTPQRTTGSGGRQGTSFPGALGQPGSGDFKARPRPVLGDPAPVTEYVNTIVTVTSYDDITHYVQLTRTNDVRVTETLNNQRTYTAEVTQRQTLSEGQADVSTALVRASRQSLVVSTVYTAVPTQRVVTIKSTVFTTTTLVDISTLRITHIDNVLEQTVLPVSSHVTVDQVETTTSTATITREVTSTIHHPSTGGPQGQSGAGSGFGGASGAGSGFGGASGAGSGFGGASGAGSGFGGASGAGSGFGGASGAGFGFGGASGAVSGFGGASGAGFGFGGASGAGSGFGGTSGATGSSGQVPQPAARPGTGGYFD